MSMRRWSRWVAGTAAVGGMPRERGEDAERGDGAGAAGDPSGWAVRGAAGCLVRPMRPRLTAAVCHLVGTKTSQHVESGHPEENGCCRW